ncbi:MAG: hypothetical protein PHH93_12490 [Prolixibacteraceae bacterium]|nr:hypothetical protein [Prolixibacteraceae bacterium]
MSRLKEIYNKNIYGVMGTLVFHILLFSAFLLADVDRKGNVREEELLIEFPDLLPEIETPEEEIAEEEEQNPAESVSEPAPSRNAGTNIASNRLAQSEELFDQDYLNEVEAARQLVSDVNNQLAKKIKPLDDIEMPVETTENMNPDSIKNVIYSGESNIVYYLENRHHLRLPVPVYLAQGGGKVIIDITVDREGKVVKAAPRSNPSIRDEQIYIYAVTAASRTLFNKDSGAPALQTGTIHYTFIPQ